MARLTRGAKGVGMAGDKIVLRQERVGDILVLLIDNPPVNALGYGLRTALAGAVTEAGVDRGVAALVILAEGRLFSAGADMREFGKAPRSPALAELCNLIESCPKPTITGLGAGWNWRLPRICGLGWRMRGLVCPKSGLGFCRGQAARSGCRVWLVPKRHFG
ncbi:MAG: enoyl-CoA hydratase/isomerase family protein [Paracoccaceae bacterium]|nr:enoyl-CoA hydratase/isomerase family protein [Paracoccaceae bacterium]